MPWGLSALSAVTLGFMLLASPAFGLTIDLSTMSSDETPASAFAGTLELNVSSSTLDLTVTNLSDYEIADVFFNGASNVTGLTLLSGPSGWTLSTQQRAGGFGVFDFGLHSARRRNWIQPGDSETFQFSIAGSGPFDDLDFRDLSRNPPGNRQAHGAAKFQSGPADDSGFGATAVVPEPAGEDLFCAGLVVVGIAILAGHRPATR